MEGETWTFIKVWTSALASFTYCYFISFNIPKGKVRFISLLPVFYILTIAPASLTTATLGGLSAFFLTWLANFKLLLFSFGQGPLSLNPSISLPLFISIACLPIKIRNKETSSAEISPKIFESPLNFATKVLALALLTPLYAYKESIHPRVMLAYYCSYMYVGLEVDLAIIAALAAKVAGLELEPQFNEPYLSTSLQDFWGRRWNLMVTNILRPTVYEPTRSILTNIIGRKWASLPAVFSAFVASEFMHELIYYYLGRLRPTWEVTWFFVFQGVLVVLEIIMKKVLKERIRFHPVVSWALTVVIVLLSSEWLFFPQLLRCNIDARISAETLVVVDFFKSLGKSIGVTSP